MDERIVDDICARLVAGEGIKRILQDEGMPNPRVFYKDMAENESLRNRIARARELQQDALVDEMVTMADDATVEDWQVVKLRIWARQWKASKLAPKKYGDALALEHSGNVGLTVTRKDESLL